MLDLLREAARHPTFGTHATRLISIATSDEPSAAADAGRTAYSSLSERELQVLRLLDSDLTGPEIARELFISPNTLRTHTKSIFTKLDVTSRRAAVRRGHDLGLS